MVRVREARRAYRRFFAQCFWSYDSKLGYWAARYFVGSKQFAEERGKKRLGSSSEVMPLTAFQSRLARQLAANRTPDNHLAGGAAIHLEPNTKRYSNDLGYFQDSVERVAEAFAEDNASLEKAGYVISIDMQQPGYIRAIVRLGEQATKVEWAHDSAWRFLPTIADEIVGYRLHPVDLAINKLLALVGRDEPRDFLDILHIHEQVLPMGAMCWAAAGKDPGYTPYSVLEMLRRRGKYRAEDFARLHLVEEVNLQELKQSWVSALESAEKFIALRPPDEVGCLYFDTDKGNFVQPSSQAEQVVPHYGRPGGILPAVGR